MSGKCANCGSAGPVGSPCEQLGCTRRAYHFIAAEYAARSESGHDDPVIGQLVGDRYLVVAPLGSGGFSHVYLALQKPLLREVALKLLSWTQNTDTESRLNVAAEKFETEARALAELNHASIVKLYDHGLHGDMPFLVMEYLSGARTLQADFEQRFSRQEALPIDTAHHLLHRIASGLRAAHSAGIVHRDVKPQNVMIREVDDEPMQVWLVDFGLAKSVTESSEVSMVAGTPQYMSPEQLFGGTVGPWTDVFSLGVLSYELLCGERPFDGGPGQDVMTERRRLTNETALPPERAARLPEPARLFLERAMAIDTQARYPTIAELLPDLDAAVESLKAAGHDGIDPGGLLTAEARSVLGGEDWDERNDEAPSPVARTVVGFEGPHTVVNELPPAVVAKPASPWKPYLLSALAALALVGGVALFFALNRPQPAAPGGPTEPVVTRRGPEPSEARRVRAGAKLDRAAAGPARQGRRLNTTVRRLAGRADRRGRRLHTIAARSAAIAARAGRLGTVASFGPCMGESSALCALRVGEALAADRFDWAYALAYTAPLRADAIRHRLARSASNGLSPATFACASDVSMACPPLELRKAEESGTSPVLQALCDAGDLRACLQLGLAQRVAQNPTGAVALFRRSCQGGLQPACAALAAAERQGPEGQADPAAAAAREDRACRNGEPFACMALAQALASGNGVQVNKGRASELFLDACRAGVAAACRLSTEWTRGALLVQRLERGCDLGDAESCTQLAGVVQNGQHDVAPDRARIDTLLGRGCRLEHGPSCKQLGAHREAGGDHVDARAAFDRACMLGSGPGCAALARVLRAGMGGEVDPEGGAEAAARACELSPPDCPPPPVEDEPDPSGQDETEPSEEPAPHEPAPAPGLGPL